MKDMYKLREMLCEELEEFSRKGKMNAGDLQTLHMLTDTIKNIDKIDGEYSHARRRRDARGRYVRDGGGYAYEDEHSYNDGRLMGEHRYARHDGKERVMEILEGMRDGVQGPERQTVERMMDMARKL